MATEKKDTKKAPAKKVAAPKVAALPGAEAASAASNAGLLRRREMTGTVVSDKMQKTIVVKVDRRVRHELYKKYMTNSRRFKAHDEKNDAKPGDLVVLIESRPMSREKRWALKTIIRRAGQTPDANV